MESVHSANKDARFQHENGFTLFELLTVIAIIAVVAAIAIPNMIGWRNRAKLGDGARDIYAALQLARSSAAKVNTEVTVSFVSGGDGFIVFVDDGQGTGDADDDDVNDGAGDGIHNGSEQTFMEDKLPSGVTIDSTTFGSDNVVFRTNGLPDEIGHVEVSNTAGEVRKIWVSMAGRVRI